jgi:hypothetical protein
MPGSEAVSDTGPLISFEKLPDGFSVLKALFSKLSIPPEVLQELQPAPCKRCWPIWVSDKPSVTPRAPPASP